MKIETYGKVNIFVCCLLFYDFMISTKNLIYIYLTAIGLTPGGSNTAHIYTQTVHIIHPTEHI
jgi:hypothetical protein